MFDHGNLEAKKVNQINTKSFCKFPSRITTKQNWKTACLFRTLCMVAIFFKISSARTVNFKNRENDQILQETENKLSHVTKRNISLTSNKSYTCDDIQMNVEDRLLAIIGSACARELIADIGPIEVKFSKRSCRKIRHHLQPGTMSDELITNRLVLLRIERECNSILASGAVRRILMQPCELRHIHPTLYNC